MMEYPSQKHSIACRKYFEKLTTFIYIVTATNFWYKDVTLPDRFVKIYNYVSKFLEAIITVFVITGFGAAYSQENLTEKQKTDVLIKNVSAFFINMMYGYTVYNKDTIKELLFTLTITLKVIHNANVQDKFLMKIKMYMTGLVIVVCCPMIAYGVEGAFNSLTSNVTFTTIIPIWPDLEDRRPIAGFARIIVYITWLLLVAHVLAIYSLIITISICVGYQFANLSEYFLSLDAIFDEDGRHEDKEKKYEEAIKQGVKMHNIILRCVDQLQSTGRVTYAGQVFLILFMMVLLMIQMKQSDRSLMQLAPILFTGTGILVSSGLFIWSAGDITFQANDLPSAMFYSGWHNCRHQSSKQVRKLIVIAMAVAQKTMVLTTFGVMELSYDFYVRIVKLSYSIFSVIY